MSSWTQHLRAWKAWEVRNPHCSRCRSGVKTHENIYDFFQQNWTPWPFFGGNVFDSFTNSCEFQNGYRVTKTYAPRGQDGKMLIFWLFLCCSFCSLEEIHFLQLLYSVWITKREKSGHFQFSKSDRLMLMTNLLGQKPASGKRLTKRLPQWFVQICSKMRLFPENDAASDKCIHVFTEDVQVQLGCCSINRLQHRTSSRTLSSLRGVNVHVDKIAHRSIFWCPDTIHIQTWWMDGL